MENCTKATNSMFIQTAKEICAKWVNENIMKRFEDELPIEADDMYIVWFCKTLQNWKAIVSTDRRHGWIFEVTCNGDKNEVYLDAYSKSDNQRIDLADYGYRK